VRQYEADPNQSPDLRDRLELLYGFPHRVYLVASVTADLSGAGVGLGAAAKALGIDG